MKAFLEEGACYRVKRFHAGDGIRWEKGEEYILENIHSVCEEKVHFSRFLFTNIKTGERKLWHRTGSGEDAGADLFERIERPASLDAPKVPAGFEIVEIKPPSEQLWFSFLKAAGFEAQQIPGDQPNFEDPTAFMPLAVFVDATMGLVFSVAARPAYSDGTVSQWMNYLNEQQGFKPLRAGKAKFEKAMGYSSLSLQQNESGAMWQMLGLLEDGGTLFGITVMGPAEIWATVDGKLRTMFTSFQLLRPVGPHAAVEPSDVPAMKQPFADQPVTDQGAPAVQADQSQQAPVPIQPIDDSKPSFALFALADDESSLDPELPYNAQFRDQGVGFVPRVLNVDKSRKAASIGCGAIEAILTIPFGWHAIDDGKRTLIFDKENHIQINLNLVNFQGTPWPEVIQSLVDATMQAYPSAEHIELAFGPDQPGLAFRNMNDNGVLLQQCFLWRPVAREGLHLQVRVTAENDHMDRAMNLLEVLMEYVRGAGE